MGACRAVAAQQDGPLFRGVGPEDFEAKVRDMFTNIAEEWVAHSEVINDGEVTASVGSMALRKKGNPAMAVLGIAMGTSEGGGYVDMDGNITTWLSELAFAPVDRIPRRRPMNGAATLRVHSISQQAVAACAGLGH